MKYIFVKGTWVDGEFYEKREKIDLEKIPDLVSKLPVGTYKIVVYDGNEKLKLN